MPSEIAATGANKVDGATPTARWRGAVPLCVAWAAFSFPALLVLPVLDNWSIRPALSQPGLTLFWRPLERLFLGLMASAPGRYVTIAHLLAIAAHGVSIVTVRSLARARGARPSHATGAAILFAVSPACAATVWNVLGTAQACSTAFGLLGTWALVRWPGKSGVALFLAATTAAALWKESGVPWFLAAPLFAWWVDARRADAAPGNNRLRFACGSGALLLYMLARTTLAAPESAWPAGRYELTADPLRWLQNLAMLAGVSLTTIDTVSLFGTPGRPIVVVASLAASLPLLTFLGRGARASFRRLDWIVGASLGVLVSAPYLPLSHVSEKYAHALVAVAAIVLAGAFPEASARRRAPIRFALWSCLLAAIAVDAHKLTALIETGRGAARVGAAVAATVGSRRPRVVCIVLPEREPPRVYSIFQAEPGPASSFGMAVLPHWNWEVPVKSPRVERVRDCPADAEMIWRVSTDGRRVEVEPVLN